MASEAINIFKVLYLFYRNRYSFDEACSRIEELELSKETCQDILNIISEKDADINEYLEIMDFFLNEPDNKNITKFLEE